MFIAGFSSCKNPDDKSFNIFSIQDDIALGAQLEAEIAANPAEYPVLDPNQFSEAYGHLFRIRDAILNSNEVFYRDDFEWKTRIIYNDEVLNAFAAPGGYIYVYTGLIKFLDTEDQFAGVLGHEIAHADRRHSTDALTKAYGIGTLLTVVLGDDPGTLAEIAAGLLQLKFGRNAEAEADEFSVIYLCQTDYAADGAAGFFEKIQSAGGAGVPEFLSTHPDPANRVVDINTSAVEKACDTGDNPNAMYQAFKNSLP